jgi:hypothetical protein
MLLSDDTVEDNIQQQIRSAWKQKTELSEKEMNIVEQCIKLLKPYMPSQKAPRCIMLHLPLVMLSNTIQRAAGYGSFTREICPHISPASIQSSPVDCRVMYKILSSSVHSDPFTMRDRQNILIFLGKYHHQFNVSHYVLRKQQQSSNIRQSVAKRVKHDGAKVKRLIQM